MVSLVCIPTREHGNERKRGLKEDIKMRNTVYRVITIFTLIILLSACSSDTSTETNGNPSDSNGSPTLNYIANMTVTEGESVSIWPSAIDPEDDPLTFSYSGGWMNSNHLTTVDGDAGVHRVVVTVSDGRGGTDRQNVWVRVNYAGPVVDPETQPLALMEDFEYEGAFIIPGDDYGESNAHYSNGTIEYNPLNHSIYLAGHNHDQAIAEFAIPELVNSTNLNDLNTAEAPLQNFSNILDRTADGNPQSIDRITGMKLFGDQMMVNGLEYYDADADNTHTTVMIREAFDVSSSIVDGFFTMQGAAHIAGWISPIPGEWQALLGGTHISGNASNLPIASRNSVGPTAFVFDPTLLLGSFTTDEIPSTALIDFSLDNRLHDDRYNETGENDLWTVVSWAVYGFIVPDTRTYVTIGSSGGHEFGLGYKATQDTGRLCPGPCSLVAADNYNYYWLWDVNDMLAVKNGDMQPYEIRPYAYGEFSVPFQTDVRNGEEEIHYIRGASYDADTGTLYVTINQADSRGQYSNNPVIAAYKFIN